MKKLIPVLLIFISVVACNTGKEITTSTNDINECDTLKDKKIYEQGLAFYGYWYYYSSDNGRDIHFAEQYGRPIVAFNNNALMYCQPDTTSRLLDTFNFNELITSEPLEHSYFNQGMYWHKIKDGNNIGYMRLADICDPKRTYFLYYSNKKLRVGFELVTDSNGSREMVAAKIFETETNKIISTSIIGPYVSTFDFGVNTYTPINKNGLLYYSSSMESCPGWTYEGFYAVNGDSVILLADGSSEGEGVYYDVDVIYLPTYIGYRKIALMPGGRNEGFNLDSFPYPKDIGVPIENLIVKFSEGADEDSTGMEHIYEKVKAYDDGDDNEENDEYLYVHTRDTQYFEYKNGKVLPIEYPKKK